LGVRAFSPNLPTTPTPLPTLLSAGLPGAPPVIVDASVPNIKGFKNPTASRIILTDRTATNGVIHNIDQVMLPQ
jgi:Fasciclin domain